MTWGVVVMLVLYCCWLVVMLIAWSRPRCSDVPKDFQSIKPSLFYSIVVPFRNEAASLEALVSSIRQNSFPQHAYEIILVDDHSTDNYEYMIEKLQGIRLLKLTAGQGKKQALDLGIRASEGHVIVTTDADCEVSKDWLASICCYFEDRQALFMSGAVTFQKEQGWFQHLQAIEFASLVGVGAANIQLKIPGMCNGANLAFKKEVFYEVGGYTDNDHLASGDDEFLLHKVSAKYPGRIHFNKARASYVKTWPLQSLQQLVQQRKRWASKWTHYNDKRNSLLAVFIGLTNLSVLGAFLYAFSGMYGMWALIGSKVFLEGLFLNKVLRFVDKPLPLIYFFALQVIYPFYVVYFAVVANLGGYTWKGRRY